MFHIVKMRRGGDCFSPATRYGFHYKIRATASRFTVSRAEIYLWHIRLRYASQFA